MTIKQLIEQACVIGGIRQYDIAAALNLTPSMFSNRLKTGKFNIEEWRIIAATVGADPNKVICFNFPDGRQVY